jgi:1-acyl-sn-glycerol-3-phosphate acyltransferase
MTMYLRWLARGVYAYTLLALGAVLLASMCCVWGLIALVLYPFLPAKAGRRAGRYGAMMGFRIFLDTMELAGAWRLRLDALDELADAGPLIIAPNHPGLLDAVLVISRLPNVACVMKATLLQNFLLAPGAHLARYVRNDTLLKLIGHANDELRCGGQLLLFPEGTRTVGDPVGPFTEAVGALSRRTGIAVQTVFIETDSAFLCKGWRLRVRPDFPLEFAVRLGRRFDPPREVRAFTADLERYFTRELGARAPGVALEGTLAPQVATRDVRDVRG